MQSADWAIFSFIIRQLGSKLRWGMVKNSFFDKSKFCTIQKRNKKKNNLQCMNLKFKVQICLKNSLVLHASLDTHWWISWDRTVNRLSVWLMSASHFQTLNCRTVYEGISVGTLVRTTSYQEKRKNHNEDENSRRMIRGREWQRMTN